MELDTVELERVATGPAVNDATSSNHLMTGLSARILERVLDHMDYGIACVDREAHLLHANRAARLVWCDLQSNFAGLAGAIRSAGSRGMRHLVEVHASGSRRFTVAVMPLAEPPTVDAPVLLVFGKPSLCEQLSSYWYGVSRGLTPAEQSVLEGITAGRSPRDIAEHHCVSVATVRSQLASVRDKTGADSIYALLREVAQLPPIRCAVSSSAPA